MSTTQQEQKTADWQATRAPGPMHELLKKFAGTWTADMTMRMGANQPEMKSTGKLKAELMFGERYLKMEEEGSFMNTPFRDFGMIGYDNYKQKFTAYWCFDMGTQASFLYGTPSADGQMIVFHGVTDEAMTGRRDMPMRLLYRWPDAHTMIFEIWNELGLPQEFKSLEITYRRQ
jgi:hypothetical protein